MCICLSNKPEILDLISKTLKCLIILILFGAVFPAILELVLYNFFDFSHYDQNSKLVSVINSKDYGVLHYFINLLKNFL